MADVVETEPRRGIPRIKFDPTINLGHVVTAGASLFMVGIAWANLDARVNQQARDLARIESAAKADAGRIEVELSRRIVETRQYVDQTQVKTAEDIKEIKSIIRDGFRDLDTRLDRKADKPGR